MPVLFRTHYQLAKSSLKRSRARSFLTCLGIAIGVASIILILSLTGSINRLIAGQISAAGNDLIVIRPSVKKANLDNFVSELTATNQYTKSNLTLQDIETISALDQVTAVAPLALSISPLAAEHTVDSATVLGTTEDLQAILGLGLRSGTFKLLEDNTNHLVSHPAVIGRDLSLNLLGTTEAVGKTFTMNNQKFLIVGILEHQNDPVNYNNVDLDNAMLIDATYLKELEDNLQIQQINVKAETSDAVPTVAAAIATALENTKNGDKNFSVYYGNQISHPSSTLFNVISSMLTLVAGISLIVGGVGVMNIMLVSVAERTHEIGIRKAVGATNANIFLQFLLESLILCFLGSLLGLVLGYTMAFLVSVFTPFPPFVSIEILLAMLYVTVVVGTLFGLYPALKAARQNPIDSLKSY